MGQLRGFDTGACICDRKLKVRARRKGSWVISGGCLEGDEALAVHCLEGVD